MLQDQGPESGVGRQVRLVLRHPQRRHDLKGSSQGCFLVNLHSRSATPVQDTQ